MSLSSEQTKAFEKFKQGENLFMTGPSGTGKSYLIKQMHEYAIIRGSNIQVCAMTGCAAMLLECKASTLHSWSGLRLGNDDASTIIGRVASSKIYKPRWRKVNCLIIDEVSMLSHWLLNILDKIGRQIRNPDYPFGGIQVVFIGDFFQLPPVDSERIKEKGEFCFQSPLWGDIFPQENQIELTQIFRQRDPAFQNILNEARRGEISPESETVLKTRLSVHHDSKTLNGFVPTKLFPTRIKTDNENTVMFKKLQAEEVVFDSKDRYDMNVYHYSDEAIPSDIMKKCSKIPQTRKEYEIDKLKKNTPCIPKLRLKIGASVMCTINIDVSTGICNGSQGIVTSFVKEGEQFLPRVKFVNGTESVMKMHYWQSEEIPTVAIGQVPLCLAYALTIHKIQGATLDVAEIDIGESLFEYGQGYVALSRVRTLDGLFLSSFSPKRITAHPKVLQFHKNIQT
jgi:ATP-dependent DNA helicase PIF1